MLEKKKKKNQRVINRTALIGPFLGPLVYMGGSRVILCGTVCHCVNPSDCYWVFWKFQYLWPDSSVGEVCKVGLLSSQSRARSCSKETRIRDVNKYLNGHQIGFFSSTLPSLSSRVSILAFLTLTLDFSSCVFLVMVYVQVCVKIYKNTSKCNFWNCNFSENMTFMLFCVKRGNLTSLQKMLSLMHKFGFMLVSKGIKYKHIMLFKLYLSHFSAPQASSKPLQSKFKAITMKETSISIV